MCRKAAAKMCDRSTSRCVSNPSRYIRSRAQKAAKWRVAVKGEQPKSVEGLTHHYSTSPSIHRAAGSLGRALDGQTLPGGAILALCTPRRTRLHDPRARHVSSAELRSISDKTSQNTRRALICIHATEGTRRESRTEPHTPHPTVSGPGSLPSSERHTSTSSAGA